jgi:flagellar motor switch protein FliN/FliY
MSDGIDMSLGAGLEEIAPAPAAAEAPAAQGLLPQGPFLRIPVTVQVVLGVRRMPLAEVMALGPGSVVVLEQELSQPVILQVNGSEVARGTLGIVDETTGQLGITLTAIGAALRSSAQP